MITVDTREVTQHPTIPNTIGIPCTVERLASADYAFLNRDSEPIGIERCEIGNFVQKVRSGELEDQLYRCQDSYAYVILLLEGFYDAVGGLLAIYKRGSRGYFRTMVYPNTTFKYVKATEVKLSEFGIEVIHSPDFKTSMETIKTIYDQRTKPEEESTLFKRTRALKLPTKLTNNTAVPKLMALATRMPEKVAIRLLNQYGSIWTILNTEDRELLEVEGLGRTLIKKLKESVGKPEEESSA